MKLINVNPKLKNGLSCKEKLRPIQEHNINNIPVEHLNKTRTI